MSLTRSLTSAVHSLDKVLKVRIRQIEKERKTAATTAVTAASSAAVAAEERRQEEFGREKPFLQLLRDKIGLAEINETSVTETAATIVLNRQVWVRVLFLKIENIDIIHDRYSADILVQTRWLEPTLNGKKMRSENVVWEDYWNPNVSVLNSIGEPNCKLSDFHLHYDRNGVATVTQRQRLNGQFYEFMELNKFPFDSQDLTITVLSDLSMEEVNLIEDDVELSGINPDAFSSTQEWKMSDKVNIWKKTVSKKVNHVLFQYPSICIAAKVSRRPQFFLWNIVIVLVAISSLAFSTFTIKMEAPESRMPLTFTLLLTTVTFKLVVNKNLPKISYLTYLDKYILGTMIILTTLCVWHALAGSVVYNVGAVAKPTATSAATTTTSTASTTAATATTTVVDVTAATVVDVTAATVAVPVIVANTEAIAPTVTKAIILTTVTMEKTTASSATTALTTTAINLIGNNCTTGCIQTNVAVCNLTYPGRVATLTGKLIDKVVLGGFATFYIIFHLVYLILIVCVSQNTDDGPNEEILGVQSNFEMDMGSTVDLISPTTDQERKQHSRRRDEGHQTNFVMAAFAD